MAQPPAQASGQPQGQPSDQVKALFQHMANWKYFAPRLYRYAQTQILEWPSLVVDWLPDRKNVQRAHDYSMHYVVTASQALPGCQNYIAIIEFAVPMDRQDAEDFFDVEIDVEEEEMRDRQRLEGGTDTDPSRPPTSDEAKTQRYVGVKGHSQIDQLIMTQSPVIKLRVMPQTSDILAAKMANGYTCIFNIGMRPKFTADAEAVHPDMRLKGHRLAGFGLAWNPQLFGHLASGADDMQILHYDLQGPIDSFCQGAPPPGGFAPPRDADDDEERPCNGYQELKPIGVMQGHRGFVHDVSWHNLQTHLLGSVSEDGSMWVWDTRSYSGALTVEAHKGGAWGIDFHPTAAFQIATCGSDRTLRLWDMRKTNTPVHTLVYHSNVITHVKWAPFSDTVLATASLDRRVAMWDVQKMDHEAAMAGDANAPPELSFLHTGHISRVTDFAWCPSLEDEWLMASVDMTNTLQLYRPLDEVVYDYLKPDAFDEDFEADSGGVWQ